MERRSSSSATNCAAEIPSPASRCNDANTSSLDCWSAPTERTAAEAGLLISWARPAARVPSATSASRWRALTSMRRAVPIRPRSRWTAKGNHASPIRASSGAVSRKTRVGSMTRADPM